MKTRTGRADHAMLRPQHLLAVFHLDRAEGRGARMVVGKAGMVGRMPVLCQDHGVIIGHQVVDGGHDFVAAGDGKAASGAEIDLRVDHDQGCRHRGLLR